MNTQNKRIQELIYIVEEKDDAIEKLQDLISSLEETIKDYVSLGHVNFLYTKNLIYAYNGLQNLNFPK